MVSPFRQPQIEQIRPTAYTKKQRCNMGRGREGESLGKGGSAIFTMFAKSRTPRKKRSLRTCVRKHDEVEKKQTKYKARQPQLTGK